MDETTPFRNVGSAEDLDVFPVVPFYIEEKKQRIAVAVIDGEPYAFDDLCTHMECPLSAGLLTDTTILCQCHGSTFNVTSGAVLSGPAADPLGTYVVKIEDGAVHVRI